MKKVNVVLGAIIIALATAGCASVGNESLRKETESTVAQKIVVGKTKKDEVRSMFGSPASSTFTEGGLEVWKYELSKMTADAVNYVPIVNLFGSSSSGTKKELVILFDNDNTVKKYSMSESPVSTKTGLFNLGG